MQTDVVAKVLDCRNQVCPKPVFMVKEAISEAHMGDQLDVIVNDDGSKQNVLRYFWNHGQEITKSYADGPDFHIIVKRSEDKRAEAPLPSVGPCGTRWD
jgi:TusA-related sulfurtransferase